MEKAQNLLKEIINMKREHETLNMWTAEEIWKKEIEYFNEILKNTWLFRDETR